LQFTDVEEPNIRHCLVVPQAGINPKVALLTAAVCEARNEVFLFTDDNLVLAPTQIQAHLAYLDLGFALVSAAAIGIGPKNLWGAVDAAFMNGYFARFQLAGHVVGLSYITSKCLMLSRRVLEESGGLKAVATHCDDAELQKRFVAGGRRATLSHAWVSQPIGERGFGEIWNRHLRWFYCRRRYAPGFFLVEGVLSSVVAMLAGGVVAAHGGLPAWSGVGTTFAFLMAVEWVLLTFQGWRPGPWYPFAWLAREILVLPLWLTALVGRRAIWRGRPVPLRA
jgi:ceramide glucosyltransferase